MNYICIDVGSSYTKSAIINPTKNTIEIQPVLEGGTPHRDGSGHIYEVDSNVMFDAFKRSIDLCIEKVSGDVAGIFISTQMHGFIFASENGEAYTPYVSWQDVRSLDLFNENESYIEYLRTLIPDEMFEESGVDIKPCLGMCNAYTMIKRQEYAIPDGAFFCTIGSYLIKRLTGKYGCHITNAAPTGFAVATKKIWNEKLINLIGFDRFRYPQIVDDTVVIGQYRDIPVYPDFGDQQCSVLGAFLNEKSLDFNIATGAQICRLSDSYIKGDFETRPYFENKFMPTITRLPSGRYFGVMMNFFKNVTEIITGQEVNESLVWQKMGEVPLQNDNDIKTKIGFFPGMLGDEYGQFSNINETNFTFNNIMASFYNRFAEVFEEYALRIMSCTGQAEELVFTGGAVSKDHNIARSISKLLGINYRVSGYSCEVFIGAMHFAFIAEGKASNLNEAAEIIKQSNVSVTYV